MPKLHHRSTSRSSLQLSNAVASSGRSVRSQEEKDLGYSPHKPQDSVASATGDTASIRWNEYDKSTILMVYGDGRSLRRSSLGEYEEIAAARASHPIRLPAPHGIYYYEVTIIDKGVKGNIGVGFCSANAPLNKMPGWVEESWGYHGDDGKKYTSSVFGTPFGPLYTTGDVIGCGIDFTLRKAFYTKNGALLGYAFDDIGEDKMLRYPAVGMRTENEAIKANFGQEPFKYDIDLHILCAHEQQLPIKMI